MQVKRAMANTSFVMSTALKEQSAGLQRRLSRIKSRWEGLGERGEKLKRRKTQLTFEKAEKVHVHVQLKRFKSTE